MIKVALVDDHAVTRAGIKAIVETEPRIRVELEASNGLELMEGIANRPVDVVVLDLNMPELSGTDTIRQLKTFDPNIKVIVFSFNQEEDTVLNMLSLGANAYVPKSIDPLRLPKIIVTVYERGIYAGEWDRKLFRHAGVNKIKAGFSGKSYLSPKEVAFIKLAATNLTYPEIAQRMGVSPKTIENYRDSLYLKLDIKNRAALAIYGLRNELLNRGDLDE